MRKIFLLHLILLFTITCFSQEISQKEIRKKMKAKEIILGYNYGEEMVLAKMKSTKKWGLYNVFSGMDIEDFSEQDVWKTSPLYMEINEILRQQVKKHMEINKNNADQAKNIQFGSKSLTSKTSLSKFGFIPKSLPVGFSSGSQTVFIPSSSNSKL